MFGSLCAKIIIWPIASAANRRSNESMQRERATEKIYIKKMNYMTSTCTVYSYTHTCARAPHTHKTDCDQRQPSFTHIISFNHSVLIKWEYLVMQKNSLASGDTRWMLRALLFVRTCTPTHPTHPTTQTHTQAHKHGQWTLTQKCKNGKQDDTYDAPHVLCV